MTQDEARAKWLAVLRDPESEKMTGALENYDYPNKRCCLGHACHALGIERSHVTKSQAAYGAEQAMYELPKEARDLLGIDHQGSFRKRFEIWGERGYFKSLVQVNDGSDLTPADMADLIEEQFKEDNFCASGEHKVGPK